MLANLPCLRLSCSLSWVERCVYGLHRIILKLPFNYISICSLISEELVFRIGCQVVETHGRGHLTCKKDTKNVKISFVITRQSGNRLDF